MTVVPSDRSTIGAKVAAARRLRGMTQRDLAEALGVSSWTIDRIEQGSLDVGRYLASIAEVTQTSREWFARSPLAASPRARVATPSSLGNVGRDLVLGSIVLLVTIRFFTEVVPVIPRAANFIDIPIFLVLVSAAFTMPPSRRGPGYLHVGGPALVFLLIALSSAIINAGRAAPAPVLVFVYGFLAPIAVYASVYRIWPAGNARALSRVLVALGLVQLTVVVFIGLPRFIASGNPDVISGTFGTNAYQLVFFLLLVAALLAGVFTLEPGRAVARFAPILILAIFVVILLAQYRALLMTTVVTIVVVAVVLGRHARGVLIAVFAVTAFGLAFSYVAYTFPRL
jgi:DNA-binding XRE family transcriptional regulator